MRYRCACKAELCEDDLEQHRCVVEKVRRIQSEKTVLTLTTVNNNNSLQIPITSCQTKGCRFSTRIVTWNMNHIAKTTRPFKKEGKTKMIQQLCRNQTANIDVLALQEVNSTAVEVLDNLGNDLCVLSWGPLLVSKSNLSRKEFAKSVPSKEPTKPSTSQPVNAMRDEIYPLLKKSKQLRESYEKWCEAVRKDADEQHLKENFKDAEELYDKAGTRERYREYYPLVARKDSPLKVEAVHVLWADGKLEEVQSKQKVEFRGPDVEAEFRPIVVYDVSRKCSFENCCESKFRLGLVHTSPSGNQFERVEIYQMQLKVPFQKIAESKTPWIIVGDYYLAAEAIVTGKTGMYQQLVRNEIGVTLENQLPERLAIVAALSGTNGGTWKAEYDRFDSVVMQVADFGICTTDFTVRRAFSIHPDSGRPMLLDVDHEGFQLMKTDDSSDHSPVLIYLAHDPNSAQEEILTMLGYTKDHPEKSQEDIQTFVKKPGEDTELVTLKQNAANLEQEIINVNTTRDRTRAVNEYLKCLERIINRSQRPQGVSELDFLPLRNCGN